MGVYTHLEYVGSESSDGDSVLERGGEEGGGEHLKMQGEGEDGTLIDSDAEVESREQGSYITLVTPHDRVCSTRPPETQSGQCNPAYALQLSYVGCSLPDADAAAGDPNALSDITVIAKRIPWRRVQPESDLLQPRQSVTAEQQTALTLPTDPRTYLTPPPSPEGQFLDLGTDEGEYPTPSASPRGQ